MEPTTTTHTGAPKAIVSLRRSQRLAELKLRNQEKTARMAEDKTATPEKKRKAAGTTAENKNKKRRTDKGKKETKKNRATTTTKKTETEPAQKKNKNSRDNAQKTEKTNKRPKTENAPVGPDGVEVCISFDTTGSMYSCLDEVRRTVKETIKRLLNDIPLIRIALVAHGDYGDEKSTYLIKTLDHTNDEKTLIDWVTNVERTSGFDFEECYELVLRDVQSLSWSPDCRNRSLVLIGDANPHPLTPRNRNPYQIDWQEEAQKLKDMDICVYAVHALERPQSRDFYQSLASITDGTYLKLPQFDSIVDFLCGICYGQNDLAQVEAYEKELRERKGGRELAPAVQELFDKLLGREVTEKVAREGGIVPVAAGRFKTLTISRSTKKTQIKTFVKEKGLQFKAGRGFYQFTKPEVISMKKEIVLVNKKSGEMFTGKSARMLLGITEATSEFNMRIKPSDFMDFDIFVQSTSHNRVLMGGTKFMYEANVF